MRNYKTKNKFNVLSIKPMSVQVRSRKILFTKEIKIGKNQNYNKKLNKAMKGLNKYVDK